MTRRLHLDTNALIALSDPSHPLFRQIEQHLQEGWTLGTDAVAWHEFTRGPLLKEDHQRALRILEDRVTPITREIAERAAELFNITGRRRASTADCLIAAACLHNHAAFVTLNRGDFLVFSPHGLKLFPPTK
ncbi:MAG: type II toxin-antitoxin system VapC family toxin [Chthoniobacterales bacterium]|nr:type II toxin-antitoxin system VapC family toxin [Chthoniobacterales bacterium]